MLEGAPLIGSWSSGVWLDLGSPSNTSASTISGYAIQPSTLGRLNDLIGTCYYGSGYTGVGTMDYQAAPPLTNTELSLIGLMYQVSFYNTLAMATMGMGGNTIPWTMIAEGDSRIARANPANIGKEYREMSRTAAEQLNYLVCAYRANVQGSSTPRSVDYPSIVGPEWGISYISP